MTDTARCSYCGSMLNQDGALDRGCPRCLLELGFLSGASNDSTRIMDSESFSGITRDEIGSGSIPVHFGRYRVLRLIGQGGMGAVYEAEQEQPRRTVALKIIKAEMASSDLLRRFEHESQVLGRLQHPGIAQIYEAGTVDSGFGPQPYFAMELIRGDTPRDYAEAHQLNLRERLEVIAKICYAVHHAHQRGIIHRDLKPGNILVDDTGQPKVLDFGVARITDCDARATLQTDVGQLVGTLAYMSPEQALADPLDIDTRSDVYALGVILYELLAGRLPYTISRNIHENIRVIREEDPARLSTANRNCRGDIETIVAKALEKDRTRRYASAAEMAADIQRFLKDEPIVARRPSTGYQLRKFARRNRALVSGIAAVFVVLIAGVVATTKEARLAIRALDRLRAADEQILLERDKALSAAENATREKKHALAAEEQAQIERDGAISERQRAVTESETVSALNDFLIHGILAVPFPRERPDPNLTVGQALARGLLNIDGKFDNQPLVEARLRETIAEAYISLGQSYQARPQLERAIALHRKVQGYAHPDSLKALKTLAELDRPSAIVPATEAAEKLWKEIVDIEYRTYPDENAMKQKSLDTLARLYMSNGKYSDAEPVLVRMIAAMPPQTDFIARPYVESTVYLIECYEKQGKTEQARQQTDKLLTKLTTSGEAQPVNQLGFDMLKTFYLDEVHKGAEAEAILNRILARRAGLRNPQTLVYLIELIQAYQLQGKSTQADQLTSEFVVRLRAFGIMDPAAIQLINIFRMRTRRSLPDLVDQAAIGLPRPGQEKLSDLQAIRNVAQAYLDQNKFGESETLYARALTVSNRDKTDQDWTKPSAAMDLAGVYILEGKYNQAETTLAELLKFLNRVEGSSTANSQFTICLLGWSRLYQHRYAEVEADLRNLEPQLKMAAFDDWVNDFGLSILGASLTGQGKFAEAEAILLSAYDGMTKHEGANPRRSVTNTSPLRPHLQEEAGKRIIELYQDWGKYDEAAKWREMLKASEFRVIFVPQRL